MKLKDFIIKQTQKTIEKESFFSKEEKIIEEQDFVFIDLEDTDKNNKDEWNKTMPTDYALINNASSSTLDEMKQEPCFIWIRPKIRILHDFGRVPTIQTNAIYKRLDSPDNILGVRPTIFLDAEKVIRAKNESDNFKIKQIYENEKYINTITFGSFPQTFVGEELNQTLEDLFQKGEIKPTGKTFVGSIYANSFGAMTKIKDKNIHSNSEYQYGESKYVRVLTKCSKDILDHSTGRISYKTYEKIYWLKVEPITWIIRNYESLPRELNPFGKAKDNHLDLLCKNVVLNSIQFYPDPTHKNYSWWETSAVRGYLNGLNVNVKQKNRYGEFLTSGGDFTNHNFLLDAFDEEVLLNQDKENMTANHSSQKPKSELEKHRDELIKKILEKKNAKSSASSNFSKSGTADLEDEKTL